MKDRVRFLIEDIHYLLEEFIMRFEEKVMRRCGVCGLSKPGHKRDCYREYARKANQRG